jgi:rubredoxin
MADPIPMLLNCPACHARHVDVGEFATRVHRTHCCQNCGVVWRPALVPTVGVQFLPGYQNEPSSSARTLTEEDPR